MSDDPKPAPMLPPPEPKPSVLKNEVHDHFLGLAPADHSGDEAVNKRLAEIEMIGEEVAAGWKPPPHPSIAPEVRYLHISRTIHQLITDRNRSVGIFLGMASLLFAAATGLLNVSADVVPIIPLKTLQYWCLPVTFGTMAVIGVFMGLILVRTRIGLIFEVAKMNALIGSPSQRVKRVNPFSIFFLMYVMVTLFGSACAGVTVAMLMPNPAAADPSTFDHPLLGPATPQGDVRVPLLAGCAVSVLYVAGFLGLYYGMVLSATSAAKLEKAIPHAPGAPPR